MSAEFHAAVRRLVGHPPKATEAEIDETIATAIRLGFRYEDTCAAYVRNFLIARVARPEG